MEIVKTRKASNPKLKKVSGEKKSKIQLFMEEMQQNPMIRIIDMKAVLR
jgi:hypothetical protein